MSEQEVLDKKIGIELELNFVAIGQGPNCVVVRSRIYRVSNDFTLT